MRVKQVVVVLLLSASSTAIQASTPRYREDDNFAPRLRGTNASGIRAPGLAIAARISCSCAA